MTTDNHKDVAAEIQALHRDLTFELQKRERPDRHPYQVGCLSGLLVVAIAQIVIGLPPESALYQTVDYLTVVTLNVAFIIGSVMTLTGAYVSRERHFNLSMRLGIFGHMSTFTASAVYALIVIAATSGDGSRPYWLAVTSVGFSVGLCYASIMRFIQMRSLLKESQKRDREKGVAYDSDVDRPSHFGTGVIDFSSWWGVRNSSSQKTARCRR